MNRVLRFYRAAIGKKVVMGVTGLIGIGYVIAHMTANLLIFRGPDAINGYARFLHSTGDLLLVARLVLLVAVILHIVAAVQLTRQSRAARPQGYEKLEPQVSTWASRTMRWGGVILLGFIVLHVLHFTTGDWQPTGSFIKGDVFGNVVTSFQIWWVSLIYLVAMVVLGFHLYHGIWASIRSLGVAQPSRQPLRRTIALVLAVVLWLGFSAVPIAVLTGIIG